MPPKRRRAVHAACALAALVACGPAGAASSGVHIDPNSPPGKEYAIPLQTARNQGDGPSPAPSPTAPAAPTSPAPPAPRATTNRPSAPRTTTTRTPAAQSTPTTQSITPTQSTTTAPATPPAPALARPVPRPRTDNGLFGAGISRGDPRSQPPTRPTNRTTTASPAAPETLIPAADRRPVVAGGPVFLFWVAAALALLAPGLAVGIGARRWRRA